MNSSVVANPFMLRLIFIFSSFGLNLTNNDKILVLTSADHHKQGVGCYRDRAGYVHGGDFSQLTFYCKYTTSC